MNETWKHTEWKKPTKKTKLLVILFIVNPLYFQLPYLQIHLLAKIVFVTPQINTWRTFMAIHRHTQSGENFELPDILFPSWGKTRPGSAFLFQLSYYKKCLFMVYLVTCFHVSQFCAFCGWFGCLERPNVVLKCYVVSLSARRLCVQYRKHELPSAVTCSALDHELNVVESIIDIK